MANDMLVEVSRTVTLSNRDVDEKPGPSASSAETPTVAEVYELHVDYVFRALRGFGVAPRNLDDAVQDVFVVVQRRLSDFRGDSSLKTWLYAICWRVGSRSRQREARAPVAIAEEPADLGGDTPAVCAERGQASRIVMEALGRLDDDKRDVLVLAALEQLTAPEIAEILEIKLNTVYSRLRAARERFKEVVADLGKEPAQ
jgi:RNA polymerase sigma-70 factor (ECF subfamily)